LTTEYIKALQYKTFLLYEAKKTQKNVITMPTVKQDSSQNVEVIENLRCGYFNLRTLHNTEREIPLKNVG